MTNKIFTLALFVAFSIFTANAQEEKEITVKTTVSDVTVFIKGAQVTRKTNDE
jgi:hypothetical protein